MTIRIKITWLFLTLLAVSITVGAHSEEHIPILKEGRKWLVEAGGYENADVSKYWIYVDGDTIIDGVEAYRLKGIAIADDSDVSIYYASESNGVMTGYYLGYGHGEDDSVKKWIPEVMLDFNFEIGKKYWGTTIAHSDFVTVKGVKRERITVILPDKLYSDPVYWIEGIGSSNSMGWVWRWHPRPIGVQSRSHYLGGMYMISVERVYEGDEIIFDKDDFRQGLSECVLQINSESRQPYLFNLQGTPININTVRSGDIILRVYEDGRTEKILFH